MQPSSSVKNLMCQRRSSRRDFVSGVVEMLPLCVAVIPWAILAGSMAVQAGLDFWQSLGMSAIVFAGAAQLVTLGMLMSGASALTIIISVFFITSQHLIYGLTLRQFVSTLPIRYRLSIGFLLTDELFALSNQDMRRNSPSVSYLLGAGSAFYLGWVVFSLIGLVMANSISDLDDYHLDFSIIATLITLLVPMIKHLSTMLGVMTSLLISSWLTYLDIEGAIVIAGCLGMVIAVWVSRLTERTE